MNTVKKIGQYLWSKKGYVVHGAAVMLVFLDPAVEKFIAAHSAYTLVGGTAWGWVLHWANGK
jgi:hypothetical protein